MFTLLGYVWGCKNVSRHASPHAKLMGKTGSVARQVLILPPVPSGLSRFLRAFRGHSMTAGGSTCSS